MHAFVRVLPLVVAALVAAAPAFAAGLRARLLLSDGTPAAGYVVSVVGGTLSVPTAADGSFALDPAPAVPFSIVASGPDGALSAPLEVTEIGAGVAELTLPEIVRDSVTVVSGVAPGLDLLPASAATVVSTEAIEQKPPQRVVDVAGIRRRRLEARRRGRQRPRAARPGARPHADPARRRARLGRAPRRPLGDLRRSGQPGGGRGTARAGLGRLRLGRLRRRAEHRDARSGERPSRPALGRRGLGRRPEPARRIGGALAADRRAGAPRRGARHRRRRRRGGGRRRDRQLVVRGERRGAALAGAARAGAAARLAAARPGRRSRQGGDRFGRDPCLSIRARIRTG